MGERSTWRPNDGLQPPDGDDANPSSPEPAARLLLAGAHGLVAEGLRLGNRLHDAGRDGDEAETSASVKALVLAWNVIARSG